MNHWNWKDKLKGGIKEGKIKLNLKEGGRGMRTAHSILNRDYQDVPDDADVVKALRVLNNNIKLLLIVLLNVRTNQIVIGQASRKIVKQQDGSYVIDGVEFKTLRVQTSKFLSEGKGEDKQAPNTTEEEKKT